MKASFFMGYYAIVASSQSMQGLSLESAECISTLCVRVRTCILSVRIKFYISFLCISSCTRYVDLIYFCREIRYKVPYLLYSYFWFVVLPVF